MLKLQVEQSGPSFYKRPILRMLNEAILKAFFHLCVDYFHRNWILQSMGYRAAADSKFGSDILLLPALEVKLDDLHVYRLQGLQGDVVGRGH